MFQARFRTAARAFLRNPSEAGIRDLLASYALLHVATNGSEAGLDAELKRIEGNARNVLAGLP